MKVQIIVTQPNFYAETNGVPAYATPMSAAVDLRACIPEQITIAAGETRKVSSGIKINIQSECVAASLSPRSGLGAKGLVLGNLEGLIDGDYQGEIGMALWNRNKEGAIVVNPGDRVAQLKFIPIVRAEFEVVSEFEETTDRGEGGFGHSGKN